MKLSAHYHALECGEVYCEQVLVHARYFREREHLLCKPLPVIKLQY
jgi:hypothetical protein